MFHIHDSFIIAQCVPLLEIYHELIVIYLCHLHVEP